AFETSIPTNTSVICTLLVPILATYGLQAPATVRVNGRKRRDDLDSLAGLIPRARPIYRARNNYLIHTRAGEGFLVKAARGAGERNPGNRQGKMIAFSFSSPFHLLSSTSRGGQRDGRKTG